MICIPTLRYFLRGLVMTASALPTLAENNAQALPDFDTLVEAIRERQEEVPDDDTALREHFWDL